MTVVARRFVAAPVRTASLAWGEISALICGNDTVAATEFAAVAGVAASAIADETLASNPLVVSGTGPRLRVYCLYGEDAISGEDKNESSLTWKPTDGSWQAFLPCPTEDFTWFSAALSAKSSRFSAYDPSTGQADGEADDTSKSLGASAEEFAIDAGRFRAL